MEFLSQKLYTGERSLYARRGLDITECVFEDGESPLKECHELNIKSSIFRWKYPLWNCTDVTLADSTMLVTARSGIWYTRNIDIKNTTIDAPKTFRRCVGVKLSGVSLPHAEETLWACRNVTIENTSVSGDYFGMNCENVKANGLSLSGNYAFDGGKNIRIENSRLISKDAFWNCENVYVKDSVIIGEYLGWNSKNLTFENCTIESNQGLCYIAGLKLINCRLIHTDLCFEYCTDIDATVNSKIDSVKNPTSGKIHAHAIDELILDPDFTDLSKISVTTDE